jgi:hypothetical protein
MILGTHAMSTWFCSQNWIWHYLWTALLCLFLHVTTTRHMSILTHPLLLSLLRDRKILRDQGVDHGGHVGHQEGVGEPSRCTWQGGDPIQFGVQDDLSFKLMHMTRLYAWKAKETSFPRQLVSWSTKIRSTHNRRNKIVFQNIPTNVRHVQQKKDMSGHKLCRVYGVQHKCLIVSHMFIQTETAGKFRKKPLMYSLLFSFQIFW